MNDPPGPVFPDGMIDIGANHTAGVPQLLTGSQVKPHQVCSFSRVFLQKLCKKLLTNGRVDRLKSKEQPKGLSPKTVRNIHQILSAALKLAREQQIILTNPAERCALPKVEQRKTKTLRVERLQSFLREAREGGVFELYYLELATGLRRGELLGLKWEDVDLQKGDPWVRRQLSHINGEITEVPLKTKKRLSYPAIGEGSDRRTERAEEKSRGTARGYSHHRIKRA